MVVAAGLGLRGSKTGVNPAPTSTNGVPSPWATFTVTLASDSISPQSVTVPSGVPIQFVVKNEGNPCVFYVGSSLAGLVIPKGESSDATIVLPAQADSADDSSPDLNLGCRTEEQRQARLVVVPPTPSAASDSPPSTSPAGGNQSLITLQDRDLQPKDLKLHPQAPLHLVILNQGGQPCLFYFGGYLRGLSIGQHGSAEVTFTPSAQSASNSPSNLSFGCLGDAQRSGRFNVS
jgi:hypothetical protein